MNAELPEMFPGERLQRPDLKGWIREVQPAIQPTLLLKALLKRS